MYYIGLSITKVLGWIAPCIAISYWIVNRGLKTTKIPIQIEIYNKKKLVNRRDYYERMESI